MKRSKILMLRTLKSSNSRILIVLRMKNDVKAKE
jgi:hypothetical protein